MLTAGSFKYFEDAHAWMRDLQSGSTQILGFHAGPPHSKKYGAGRLLRSAQSGSVGRATTGGLAAVSGDQGRPPTAMPDERANVHERIASVSSGALRLTVSRMSKVSRVLGLALCGWVLSACTPVYRLDIQQGNLFSKSLVDSLKPGMTKRQVIVVMGSPSVVSPFQQNRWDYVSTIRRGNGRMETKDLVLYFENDALARIEGDYFAENPQELIKEATKYKRQYPDDKRPKEEEEKRKQGGA